MVASLQDSSQWSSLTSWYSQPVCSCLPNHTRVGLCDRQTMIEVTVCHFWYEVIKDTVASTLVILFWITCSGESQLPCHKQPQKETHMMKNWGLLPAILWVSILSKSLSPGQTWSNFQMTIAQPIVCKRLWARITPMSSSQIPDPQKNYVR